VTFTYRKLGRGGFYSATDDAKETMGMARLGHICRQAGGAYCLLFSDNDNCSRRVLASLKSAMSNPSFFEPSINFSQSLSGLISPALLQQQATQTHHRSQLQQLCLLAAGYLDGLFKAIFCLGNRR